MVQLTPELAGLISQVFPALFIAVLIEGRLRKYHPRVFWLNLFVILLRGLSLAGAAFSTLLCLLVAGGTITLPAASPVWWVVAISGLGLALTLGITLGQHVGYEMLELVQGGVPEGRRKRLPVQASEAVDEDGKNASVLPG